MVDIANWVIIFQLPPIRGTETTIDNIWDTSPIQKLFSDSKCDECPLSFSQRPWLKIPILQYHKFGVLQNDQPKL